MTHQLECPLRDSSYGISILDELTEREGRHNRHRMRLKVVTQLPFGDKDSVQEFLDLGLVSLGIGQDLANEVHGMLHFEGVDLFFSLHHQDGADHLRGGRNVEQKQFFVGRRDQDRGLRQKLLDHVKCLLGHEGPFETVSLLQEPIEWETSFAEV